MRRERRETGADVVPRGWAQSHRTRRIADSVLCREGRTCPACDERYFVPLDPKRWASWAPWLRALPYAVAIAQRGCWLLCEDCRGPSARFVAALRLAGRTA